jgi:N utilization substance protein A
MASALYQSIEMLSRDKGIDPGVVISAVEDAIALATRKYYKTQENMRAEMDRETGEIRAYVYKTVVETPEQVEDAINQLTIEQARELAPEVEVGGELRFYKDTSPLGRLAAQMAKQVIVSRAAPALVQNLFQSEVPEIYDGTVSIKAIAREAGERTKIAVMSRDKDVDPVGACVGMKGMRVQSIIRELRGEKIDIIEFSDEITTFAEKALQPAKVSRVSITDLGEKQLEVIVDDTQLSLAIGKKGQNVRLAAKLLQWKIDIKSEEEKRQEVEQQMQAMSGGPTTPIEQVTELGETILEKLIAAGITTVEALADMTPEQLEEVPGIGEKTVEKISVAVRHYFGQLEEGRSAAETSAAASSASQEKDQEETQMEKGPEAILAEAVGAGRAEEVRNLSAEDLAAAEDVASSSDAYTDADAREEQIELDNDAVDTLVDESQEVSREGIDEMEEDRE